MPARRLGQLSEYHQGTRQIRVILLYDDVRLDPTRSVASLRSEISMPNAFSTASKATPLDGLPLHTTAIVQHVVAPPAMPDWAPWLAEIGFLPGEAVQVIARSALGGDPLVVRIGDSTFALRKAEAACVQVILVVEKVAA